MSFGQEATELQTAKGGEGMAGRESMHISAVCYTSAWNFSHVFLDCGPFRQPAGIKREPSQVR